ncbi:MAG: hypothetical protein MI919_10605 [Holophagales bacterium]|nr:hypothetical protein [Holophagales bacterium]
MQDLTLGYSYNQILPFLMLGLVLALVLLNRIRAERERPRWDRYEEDYGPPTAEELAEIERSRGPGAFQVRGRKSAVSRHFLHSPSQTRISSTGGRQTINDDAPNVEDQWYEGRD